MFQLLTNRWHHSQLDSPQQKIIFSSYNLTVWLRISLIPQTRTQIFKWNTEEYGLVLVLVISCHCKLLECYWAFFCDILQNRLLRGDFQYREQLSAFGPLVFLLSKKWIIIYFNCPFVLSRDFSLKIVIRTHKPFLSQCSNLDFEVGIWGLGRLTLPIFRLTTLLPSENYKSFP